MAVLQQVGSTPKGRASWARLPFLYAAMRLQPRPFLVDSTEDLHGWETCIFRSSFVVL